MEDRVEKGPNQSSKKKKRIPRKEDSLRDLWDNINDNNTHIIRVPESKEREQGIKSLFEEIMTKNFPNLVKKKDTQSKKHRESQTR